MDDTFRTWLPLAAGAAAAVVPWVKLSLDARKDRRSLEDLARAAVGDVIDELRAEVARLLAKVDGLEEHVEALSTALAEAKEELRLRPFQNGSSRSFRPGRGK